MQFRSTGMWRNLPYFAISPAFRHSEVQKDCQNRKREIGYMPLENCPFLKTAYFQSLFLCGHSFNQTKKGEKAVNVSLLTVRHVFVGFREWQESGSWKLEYGMRNSQPLSFCYLRKIISHSQFCFFLFFFFLIIEL